MKIKWQRKLTSRKLWVSIAGFAAGLIVLGNGSQETADKISGAILSGAAVVGYVLGEGLSDSGKGAEAINRTYNGDDGAKRSEAEELPLASERSERCEL